MTSIKEALERAERKLSAYVGVCRDDKELTGTILPMVRAALASTLSLALADAILATGCVPGEAAKATDGDEAYELGKRDGYESAIQDLDIATGGDGEFRGSTIPDETVDVPTMKARVIARLRDESRLRQCTICGFTVDTSFAAVKPSADFTTRGRAKSLPNESAIRADEREKCAQEAFTAVTHVVIPDDGNTTLADHVAAAIRTGGAK